MKKFLFIVIALIATIAVQAQLKTLTVTIPNTYGEAVVDATTKVTNSVAGYILIKAPQNYPTTQDLVVKLDSVSGNHTSVAVALWGQKSATKGDWTAIGSAVTWTTVPKPSVDTTIVISNATLNRYQNYKLVITGAGTGVTKCSFLSFKQFLER